MNTPTVKPYSLVEHILPTSLWLDGPQAHLTVGPCPKKVVRGVVAGARYVSISVQPEEYWVTFVSSKLALTGQIRVLRTHVDKNPISNSDEPIASLVVWRMLPDGTRRKVCEREALVESALVPPDLAGEESSPPDREVAIEKSEEELLKISNDGPRITSTNYWDTPVARAGKVLVSVNAGHARLLIPECMECELPDMMRGASRIEVDMLDPKQWREGSYSFEWAFVDGTDQPYLLQCESAALFCGITPQGEKGGRTASLWVRRDGHPHRYAELPLIWRTVPALRGGDPIR